MGRPIIDGRLKQPCPRPADRDMGSYGTLFEWSIDAQLNIECNEAVIKKLGEAADGTEPKLGGDRE